MRITGSTCTRPFPPAPLVLLPRPGRREVVNITDAATQNGMFAYVNKFEKKPYPSLEGVKRVLAIYDPPEMRKHTAEEFVDSTLVAQLDKFRFLSNPR